MKKYIKPIIDIDKTGLEGCLLVGKQSKPENKKGDGSIFSNRGGYDDELFDNYEKPGDIWDTDEDEKI